MRGVALSRYAPGDAVSRSRGGVWRAEAAAAREIFSCQRRNKRSSGLASSLVAGPKPLPDSRARRTMLGLEGYGSGSDDASDDDDGGGRVTLIARDEPPAPAPEPAPSPSSRPDAPPAPRQPLDFASKLPPPKVTTGNLFASLPPPGASAKGGKRVVQFRAPLKTSALAAANANADADEDEDQSAKRRKTAPAQRASLADLLPKPKADAALGAGRASGEGGGATIDLGDAAGPGPSSAAAAADASAPARGFALHPSRICAVDESGRARTPRGTSTKRGLPLPILRTPVRILPRARARPDSTWTPRLRRRWRRSARGEGRARGCAR